MQALLKHDQGVLRIVLSMQQSTPEASVEHPNLWIQLPSLIPLGERLIRDSL